MNDRFKELYDEITGQTQISYERLHQVMFEIRALGNISSDLLEAITEQFDRKNWGALFRLIGIIHYIPNKEFTPILCEILDNHKEQGIAENVVDALFEIGDESSVSALVRSLDYYEPGDDDRHLNRKIIDTLSRIGTQDAIDLIKQALGSEDEIIREAARAELHRLGES